MADKDGFSSTTEPFIGTAISALVMGMSKATDAISDPWVAIDPEGNPATDRPLYGATWGVPSGIASSGGPKSIADFGLVSELAKCLSYGNYTLFADIDIIDKEGYPSGPYATSAARIEELIKKQRDSLLDIQADEWEYDLKEFTPPTAEAAIGLLANNTAIWGTGAPVDTLADMLGLPDTYYSELLGHAASGLTFSTDTIPAITTPTLTWVAPTGGAITAATIAAPTAVDVADNVDDAVEAFTTLANTRLAADQAQLRATLFSTRQAMSSTFDGALAILAANAAAQITDYDKSARLEQARTQAQADMEHQRLSVQVNSQNAQLALDADKANSQFALSSKDTETRFLLGAASAVTAAQSAANEVGISIMRARGELLRMIYDTTIAWMGAKASILTNAGPVASVINNAYELQYKADTTGRQQELDRLNAKAALTTQYASNELSQAAAKWNALTQNLQLYRDVINTAGGIGGSTHKPSTFENVSAVTGMAAGVISTGIQVALAFAG